jgi:methylmalonyl-CoA/ethylmalonyl-CoA epimerase
MTTIRRLDHIAIAVRDTDEAISRLSGGLGLPVVGREEIDQPRVRLTYLDCGNALIQLVEPLDEETPIAAFLAEHGEGLHHVCFGVDDVSAGAAALSTDGAPPAALGSGRGRPSAFVAGERPCGVTVEVTEFRRREDVDQVAGWLEPDRDAPDDPVNRPFHAEQEEET